MNKPILLAASLDELSAETIMQLMGMDYPGLSFSRVLNRKSKLWKIYCSSLPGIKTNETEIKRHCMKLIRRINA